MLAWRGLLNLRGCIIVRMVASDTRLAIGLRLLSEDCPLKELYLDVSEELDVEWEEVRNGYRFLRRQGLIGSGRLPDRSWQVWANEGLQAWVDQALAESVRAVGAIRTEGRNFPPDQWKALMQAFRRGELGIAFYPAGAPVVAYKDPETGETVRINGPD